MSTATSGDTGRKQAERPAEESKILRGKPDSGSLENFHRKYRERGAKGIVLMAHLEFCRILRTEVGIGSRNVKT